jgi:O-antigen biosynthesis protein
MQSTDFLFSFIPREIGSATIIFRAIIKASLDGDSPDAEVLGSLHLIVAEPQISRDSHGSIETYGYSASCRGWLLSGWLPRALYPANFDTGQAKSSASTFADYTLKSDSYVMAIYERADVEGVGFAYLLFIGATPRDTGALDSCIVSAKPDAGEQHKIELRATALTERLSDPVLVVRAQENLREASPSVNVVWLKRVLSQQGYSGDSTLNRLRNVHLAIDEAIMCTMGIVLIGWMFDPFNEIDRIILHHDQNAVALAREEIMRIERPDVAVAFQEKYGTVDQSHGFMAFVPVEIGAFPEASIHVEVISRSGGVGYQNVPEPKLLGMAAIKLILSSVSPRYDDVDKTFRLIGPCIAQLNRDRLARPADVRCVQFGEPPMKPVCSVIVPIYGRLDFIEDQMAIFSRGPSAAAHQFIYILDDPPRRQEFLSLCESVFNRFHIAMTVLVLSENLGFAPACNHGLAKSDGEFVCYLNSDVFPIEDTWLDSLIDDLRNMPTVGVIGPLLLFEDDTVQHCQMTFEKVIEYGNLPFPRHVAKGLTPEQDGGVEEVTAITGACMVMRRSLANAMGGFDESFIIGDFEDADLCMRIRQDGLTCAVDSRVKLHHLERQSQLTSRSLWRMNMTIFNAWTHANRWMRKIDSEKER